MAVYQGLAQNLGPFDMSEVYQDRADIQLKYLPEFTRSSVTDTISVDSLAEARNKASTLAHMAYICRTQAAEKARRSTTAASPAPTLSAKDQTLAEQCPSGQ